MSMFGKMSVGIERMLYTPRIKMSSANTTNVYGRRSARRTIHIKLLPPPGRFCPSGSHLCDCAARQRSHFRNLKPTAAERSCLSCSGSLEAAGYKTIASLHELPEPDFDGCRPLASAQAGQLRWNERTLCAVRDQPWISLYMLVDEASICWAHPQTTQATLRQWRDMPFRPSVQSGFHSVIWS